ncbi:hypothetical protein [Anaerovibrio slackiae]|uniref:O-linked N-acetylglucosamine transferase, SPINDLY family protein n=1 Tax=Anaerovibrio slackiae TaxID=2652309 RepID=UPI00386FE795
MAKNERVLYEIIYEQALDRFQQRDYQGTMDLLADVGQWPLVWLRPFLLRAYALRGLGCYVQEMMALQDLLQVSERIEVRSASDTAMIAEAWSLLGEALVNLGDCRLAVEAFLQSASLEVDIPKRREEYSNAIFAANYCSDFPTEKWLELYDGYRTLLSDIEIFELPGHGKNIYHHDRLRIGYLSADIRCHPVAYFLRPLLECHDSSRFQVFLYRANAEEDSVTRQLQGWADATRLIAGLADEEVALQIARDEIDVLVDLSGHTKGNRLPVLAYRPAPVLLSGLGYFNSTGMPLDGFLSDVYCSPSAVHPAFSEKLLRLPQTHFCYVFFEDFPAVTEQMAWERNGYITFGCFNNFSKVTDEMLLVWKNVLKRCAGSHLVMKHKLFDSEEGRHWTNDRLCHLGLPVERIELRGFSADYLQEYGDIDIALDTFPYTGGLTTVEALLMGVPVVSLYGKRHGTRFGLSFLSNLGLTELATDNKDDYAGLAAGLAQDKKLLRCLHRELRGMVQESPLMDGIGYCRNVENLYGELAMMHGCL